MSSFWDWFTGADPRSTSTLNPNQQAVDNSTSTSLNNRVSGGYQQFLYPGQLTAPITEGEQQGVANSARLAALTGNTVNQIGSYDPNAINAQFDSTIQRPALENWQNNIAPYLRENLSGFSSEQGNVLSRALTTEQNNLDQMRMGYQQQQQVNALNALNTGNAVNATNQGIQAVPREIQQAGLNNNYTNFINANQQYTQSLNQALQYLGIQTQAFYNAPNYLAQIVGGAQSAANINQTVQSGNNQQQQANSYAQMAQMAQMMASAGA